MVVLGTRTCAHRVSRRLPPSVRLLTAITSCRILADNQLQTLPSDAFAALNNLQTLYDISFHLQMMTLMTTLCRDLSGNLLTATRQRLEGVEALTTLDLSRNNIEHLSPELFMSLPSLSNLTLSGNRITSFESKTLSVALRRLRHLDASANRLVTFPIDSFINLSSLTLSDNAIVGIALAPDVTNAALRLRSLDLRHNRLESVPAELLAAAPALNEFLLGGNRLECVPNLLPQHQIVFTDIDVSHATSTLPKLTPCWQVALLRVCRACPSGSFNVWSGHEPCRPCAPGSFQADEGSRSCHACPPDSFLDESGGTSVLQCSPCAFGHTAGAGAVHCSLCLHLSTAFCRTPLDGATTAAVVALYVLLLTVSVSSVSVGVVVGRAAIKYNKL